MVEAAPEQPQGGAGPDGRPRGEHRRGQEPRRAQGEREVRGRRRSRRPAPRPPPRRRQVVQRRQEDAAAPARAARRPRSSPAGAARTPGGGGGRGPHALALEPRQGHVPRGGLHQGAGDRLLHARRAGAAAAPARPSAHAQALSRTAWRASTSTRSSARRTGPTGWARARDAHRPQDDRLLPLRRPPDARLDGEPGRPRAAPVAVAGRRDRAPDRDGVRPRPGPARRHRGVLRGGRAAARDARRAWGSSASRRPRARRASRSTCRSTAARRPTTTPSRSRRRSRAIWRRSTRS